MGGSIGFIVFYRVNIYRQFTRINRWTITMVACQDDKDKNSRPDGREFDVNLNFVYVNDMNEFLVIWNKENNSRKKNSVFKNIFGGRID